MEVNTDINIKEASFSHQVLKELSSFLNTGPRYRFAFVRNEDKVLNIPSVNIGNSLASFIHDNEHTDINAECYAYIKQLIYANTQHNPILGKFIYLNYNFHSKYVSFYPRLVKILQQLDFYGQKFGRIEI